MTAAWSEDGFEIPSPAICPNSLRSGFLGAHPSSRVGGYRGRSSCWTVSRMDGLAPNPEGLRRRRRIGPDCIAGANLEDEAAMPEMRVARWRAAAPVPGPPFHASRPKLLQLALKTGRHRAHRLESEMRLVSSRLDSRGGDYCVRRPRHSNQRPPTMTEGDTQILRRTGDVVDVARSRYPRGHPRFTRCWLGRRQDLAGVTYRHAEGLRSAGDAEEHVVESRKLVHRPLPVGSGGLYRHPIAADHHGQRRRRTRDPRGGVINRYRSPARRRTRGGIARRNDLTRTGRCHTERCR